MNIQVEGLKELNTKFKQLAKVSEQTMKEELTDVALDLASKCSNAAPVDSGDLRGELANPRRNKDGFTSGWEVGASLPYTRYQHERTDLNHPKGGGAKFIEKPFNENKDKYIKEIGRVIESRLK